MTDNPLPICPLPHDISATVQMAHGGGGRAMKRLIDTVFRQAFHNEILEQQHDGAVFGLNGRVAMTTDSYVVSPLFFPGGDIGSLAVNGTVNDLAMCGAIPRYLSAGFVLEEGLDTALLIRIAASMAAAAKAAEVIIVTGDTKVVDRGKADGVYINTTGVGEVVFPHPVCPASVRSGDVILLSGDIGRHGIAIMASRDDLGLETDIRSDCGPLVEPVRAMMDAGITVHCLRDLTRGGLATALVEIAETTGLTMQISEDRIPVRSDVNAVCELLGLDPLYVANEGRFIAFIDGSDCDAVLNVLNDFGDGTRPCIIGHVGDAGSTGVTLQGSLGSSRVLDMLTGNQLPRIC